MIEYHHHLRFLVVGLDWMLECFCFLRSIKCLGSQDWSDSSRAASSTAVLFSVSQLGLKSSNKNEMMLDVPHTHLLLHTSPVIPWAFALVLVGATVNHWCCEQSPVIELASDSVFGPDVYLGAVEPCSAQMYDNKNGHFQILTLWVVKSHPPLTQSASIWPTGNETQRSTTLHIAFLSFWGLLGGFPETGSEMRHKDIKLQLRISFTDQKCILDHRSALWISAKRFSGFVNDFKHSRFSGIARTCSSNASMSRRHKPCF